jgi:hypothetical protein
MRGSRHVYGMVEPRKGRHMDYSDCYGDPFRGDLHAVLRALPSPHATHTNGRDIFVQPRTLSDENPVIRNWDQSHVNLFATALFYTVLIDQVCHYYFRSVHPRFERLTRYPKLTGDCPGACSWNLHPSTILNGIAATPGCLGNRTRKAKLVDGSREVMRNEVLDFFDKHLPEVDGDAFWALASDEISV